MKLSIQGGLPGVPSFVAKRCHLFTPFSRAILITALGTIAAVLLSNAAIYITDLALPNFTSRFDNYAFSTGIPLFVGPLLIYPLTWLNCRLEKAHEELQRIARTDVLTGVANRRGFFEKAETAFGANEDMPLAVMMVDIDHFKRVNDRYGHAAGDELLKRVATMIGDEVNRGCNHPTCLIARLGGEEFIALVAGAEPARVAALAARICHEAPRAGVHVSGDFVSATVSIGVAMRAPGQPLDDLMRLADKAAYDAKHAGRNRWILTGFPEALRRAVDADSGAYHRTDSAPQAA